MKYCYAALFFFTLSIHGTPEYYTHALTTRPHSADVALHVGNLHLKSDKLEKAIATYEHGLQLEPNNQQILYGLARCYKKRNDIHNLIKTLEALTLIEPDKENIHHELSTLYRQNEQLEKAVTHLRICHELQPKNIRTIIEMANILNMLERDIESMEWYLKALEIDPHLTSALYNFGFTLKKLGDDERAIIIFEQVIKQQPDYALAHFSLASSLLSLGNLQRGFKEYEWRWQAYNESPIKFDIPVWNNEDLNNKTLLLYAEQGLGDTFQFIRYAQEFKQRGATVFVETQDATIPLLKLCPSIDRVFSRTDTIPHADYQLALMSAPLKLETRIDSIPNAVPYLQADDQLVDYWHDTLSHDTNLKVGICWQGNAHYSTQSLRRAVAKKSIPLEHLATLSAIDGVSIYSLQHIDGTEQLDTLENHNIHVFGPEFDNLNGRFMDTAAIINHMDIVISVDTAVGHLAGALGAETWLLLPKLADWRWMKDCSNSPWYPNMQLFRQKESGDWDFVIAHIKQALSKRVIDNQKSFDKKEYATQLIRTIEDVIHTN